MDISNTEEIKVIDENPSAVVLEKDENSKLSRAGEACSENAQALLNSPEKRQYLTGEDETKQSTDCTRKEHDERLTDSSNVQLCVTVSTADHSEKCQEVLDKVGDETINVKDKAVQFTTEKTIVETTDETVPGLSTNQTTVSKNPSRSRVFESKRDPSKIPLSEKENVSSPTSDHTNILESSISEEIQKDSRNLHAKNPDEELPIFQESEEVCAKHKKQLQCDTPVCSPVKRKSEPKDDEIKRRRSTDCIAKEKCSGKNLTDNASFQDVIKSVKFGEYDLSTGAFSSNVETNKNINPSDESSKENNIESTDKTHESYSIQKSDESVPSKCELSNKLQLEYDSSAGRSTIVLADAKSERMTLDEQNEMKAESTSENIKEFKNTKLDSFDAKNRIYENSPTEKHETERENSKYPNIGGTGIQNEKIRGSPVISPVKRKSEQTVEDEIKRRRSTNSVQNECVKDLSESRKQDNALTANLSENSKNILESTEKCPSNIKKKDIKDQNKIINKKDNSTIKEMKEKDFAKDENEAPSDESEQFLHMEGLAARIMLAVNRIPSSPNKNVCSSDAHDRTIPEKSKLDSPNKSDELNNSPNKQSEELLREKMPPPPIPKPNSPRRRDPRISRANTFSTSGFNLHPVYVEPEPENVPIECYERDPDFIQSQMAIYESISRQHNAARNRSRRVDTRSEEAVLRENLALVALLEFMHIHRDKLGNMKKLNSLLKEFAMNYKNVPYFTINYPEYGKRLAAAVSAIKSSNEISDGEIQESSNRAASNLEFRENPRSPASPPPDEENERSPDSPTPDEENRRSPNSPTPDEENPNSPDPLPLDEVNRRSPVPFPLDEEIPRIPCLLSPIKNLSPNSSPPHENQENNRILESDYPRFREYPGLAAEPTKVKKDARYQKKFYKQKPVKLPINWKVAIPSTESGSNIDSEKDKQATGDDPGVNSEDNEDRECESSQILSEYLEARGKRIFHENSPDLPNEDQEEKESLSQGDRPEILSKDTADYTDENRKSGQEDLSETCAIGYKISSFMEESPPSPTGSCKSDSAEKGDDSPSELEEL